MEIFGKILSVAGALPDWVLLAACPALLVACALLAAVFHKEKPFVWLALFFGGAGLFLAGAAAWQNSDIVMVFAWIGCYLVVCVVARLLFFIPFGKNSRERRKEEMYEKFRVPLEEKQMQEIPLPSRVVKSEESGVSLDYAENMLKKLFACPLNASDRMEAVCYSHTLAPYRGKDLTTDELAALNDCLAGILKLSAKYRL